MDPSPGGYRRTVTAPWRLLKHQHVCHQRPVWRRFSPCVFEHARRCGQHDSVLVISLVDRKHHTDYKPESVTYIPYTRQIGAGASITYMEHVSTARQH